MRPIVIILTIGLVYSIFYLITGFGIPCPIKTITGLYCPGCGISRMFIALIHGDIQTAVSSNIVVFFMLPFFAAGYVRHQYRFIRYNEKGLKRWENVMTMICIFILLAFAVVRNIFPIDILVP